MLFFLTSTNPSMMLTEDLLYLHLRLSHSSWQGPAVYIVGCLAAPLASPHQVLVAPRPQAVTTKNVSRHCLVSQGGWGVHRIAPLRNTAPGQWSFTLSAHENYLGKEDPRSQPHPITSVSLEVGSEVSMGKTPQVTRSSQPVAKVETSNGRQVMPPK